MSAPRRRLVQGLTWISIALFVVLVLVVILIYTVALAACGVSPTIIVWLVSTVSASAVTVAASLLRAARRA